MLSITGLTLHSKRLAVVATALLLIVSSRTEASEGWGTSYEKALAQAAKENKDVLIDFTGSDWCGYCIQLDKNVFSQPEFKKEAPKHFVLLELDFPRGKKLDPALTAQNQKLQREFGVQGFPTIFLIDKDGRPYARTGFQKGSASNYVKHLMELRKVRVERDKHFAAAEKATGAEKAKHLGQGLAAMDDSFVLKKYGKVVDEIIKLDADNKSGYKLKYELKREIVAIQEAAITALRSGASLDDVIKRVDTAIGKTGAKGETAQQLFSLKAQIRLNQDRNMAKYREEVISLIEKAIAAAPQSQLGLQMAQILPQIKAQKPPAK